MLIGQFFAVQVTLTSYVFALSARIIKHSKSKEKLKVHGTEKFYKPTVLINKDANIIMIITS